MRLMMTLELLAETYDPAHECIEIPLDGIETSEEGDVLLLVSEQTATPWHEERAARLGEWLSLTPEQRIVAVKTRIAEAMRGAGTPCR